MFEQVSQTKTPQDQMDRKTFIKMLKRLFLTCIFLVVVIKANGKIRSFEKSSEP